MEATSRGSIRKGEESANARGHKNVHSKLARVKTADWIKILRHAALSGKRAILANYSFVFRNEIVGRGSGGDLTLKVDKVSERAILRSLNKDLKGYPFTFFSEEMGERKAEEEERAVIVCDPLDGSHNAQVGIPLFSISLAVIEKKKGSSELKRSFSEVNAAFILSVQSNDEYYAVKGSGAYHNRKRIEPMTSTLGSSVNRFNTLGVECGDISYLRNLISNLTPSEVYKFRVLGSAAMSLCLLAEGAFEAFLFAQPKGARSIDSCAGYLIARESKCYFSDLSGKLENVDDCEISFDSRINLAGARSKNLLRHLLDVMPSFSSLDSAKKS